MPCLPLHAWPLNPRQYEFHLTLSHLAGCPIRLQIFCKASHSRCIKELQVPDIPAAMSATTSSGIDPCKGQGWGLYE